MRNRVVISGYYGFKNMGDELILSSIIEDLKNMGCEITVLSIDPTSTLRDYGVQSLHRSNVFSIIRAISRSDVLISGGGSLLQDVTSKRSILYYLALILMAKLMGKRTALYAQGVGPISSKLNRLLTRWIVSGVDCITLRDAESRDELRRLGVRSGDISVVADPALSFNGDGFRERGGPPAVAISLRQWKGFRGYKRDIADAADHIASKLGARIEFVPMHPPEDTQVSFEVAGMMSNPARVHEVSNPIQAVDAIAGADMLIGMRLHSLIVAALYFIPMVGISYDPKIDRFLRQVDQPLGGNVESLDGDVLISVIDRVWDKREEYRSRLRQTVPILRARAGTTPLILWHKLLYFPGSAEFLHCKADTTSETRPSCGRNPAQLHWQ
ncbi:MAG: polysaccharide pyruvyl transferase CsaB [bacterium]